MLLVDKIRKRLSKHIPNVHVHMYSTNMGEDLHLVVRSDFFKGMREKSCLDFVYDRISDISQTNNIYINVSA